VWLDGCIFVLINDFVDWLCWFMFGEKLLFILEFVWFGFCRVVCVVCWFDDWECRDLK